MEDLAVLADRHVWFWYRIFCVVGRRSFAEIRVGVLIDRVGGNNLREKGFDLQPE